MRIVNKKLENERAKLYYEQYDSYQEFLKTVEERDKNSAHGSHTLKENANEGRSWCGVKDYDEARNLLINGWDAKVEELKRQFEKENDLLDHKKIVRQVNDIVGFMPNVPNAIIGLPQSMINGRVEHKKSKVIKFLLDTCASCSESSESIVRYFSKVLARISVLEKNGYRCRIEVFQSYTRPESDRTKACFSVLIKSENQLFDIKRIAFPMAHTAMFRVFGFGWENSLPIDYDSYHCSGLGTPMYHWSSEKRENIINAVRNQNEKVVYVNYNKNLEQIFSDLK